jgi:prephenate dehydrogenase
MTPTGIIGYGRFGRLWARLLAPLGEVRVTDAQPVDAPNFLPLPDLCARAASLWLCVPINRMEAAARQIRPHLRPGTTVLDTCSVKLHPADVMQRELAGVDGITLIATHPMFGPDSAAAGAAGLPMAAWHLHGDAAKYRAWIEVLRGMQINVVELSPEEHDRLAAFSQGLAHTVGRALDEMRLAPSPLDTPGFKALLALAEQTRRDSWELFRDMQAYNPFAAGMRRELDAAFAKVAARLEGPPGHLRPPDHE